ncbi:MAG: hypothetical protein ISS50_02340 [Anaerolineae bacterium]|nr:hypothetical protein [Anaerolineae bacterium]
MLLLNLSHPLTPNQLQRIGELIEQPVARVDGGQDAVRLVDVASPP